MGMENSSISSRLTAGECELINLLLIDSRDLELIDRLSIDSSGSCVRSRDDKKSQLFIDFGDSKSEVETNLKSNLRLEMG